MANTPTTPASLAARLTDKNIELMADNAEADGLISTAAVLRDYVRLRNLTNAVREKVAECRSCDTYNYTEYCREAIEDIERLLAEEGAGDGK